MGFLKTVFNKENAIIAENQFIGKHIFTKVNGELCGGIITQTEILQNEIVVCAIVATHGEELMLKRTKCTQMSESVTNTADKVRIALGVPNLITNEWLQNNRIWIENRKE